MQNSPWSHSRQSGVSDDVDFEIKGQELQFCEIELDPGESAVAEAGAMVWKDASVEMTTVFGDGSAKEGGFMDKMLGAGKKKAGDRRKPVHNRFYASGKRQGTGCLWCAGAGDYITNKIG